jgi:chemotaxis protein MotC
MAAEPERQPYELVRELQDFQNGSVLSSEGDPADQKERMTALGEILAKADPKVWSEARNARAAVVYVLSGGDPRLLRQLTQQGVTLAIDERLVKGALAYGERQDDKAIEYLSAIDMDQLEPSIAGHVALVHGLLIAAKDPRKAAALFDIARVTSAGTIVEEAALRRAAMVAARSGNMERFEALASQYFRRFPGSRFAQSFAHQFAEEVVSSRYTGDPKRVPALETLLGQLPEAERRDVCLAVAEEGIALAKVEMVRFAARLAGIDAKQNARAAARLMLFEAAASIVTDDSDKALAALNAIDRSMLSAREEALLHAALAVSREMRRPPVARAAQPSTGTDKQDAPEEASATLTKAQQTIAQVDQLLSEAAR